MLWTWGGLKHSFNPKLKKGPKATSACAMDWKGAAEVLIARVLLTQQSIPVEAATSRPCYREGCKCIETMQQKGYSLLIGTKRPGKNNGYKCIQMKTSLAMIQKSGTAKNSLGKLGFSDHIHQVRTGKSWFHHI